MDTFHVFVGTAGLTGYIASRNYEVAKLLKTLTKDKNWVVYSVSNRLQLDELLPRNFETVWHAQKWFNENAKWKECK